jgi:hypothetical protein
MLLFYINCDCNLYIFLLIWLSDIVSMTMDGLKYW